MSENNISVSLPGGVKVLNPTPIDPRKRVTSLDSIINDASYYIGFDNIYDEDTSALYNITDGSATAGWTFSTGTTAAGIKELYESNDNTNAFTDALKLAVESISSSDASLYAIATLDSSIDQIVDSSLTKNAVCDETLLGDLVINLKNLTSISIGVINISSQATTRSISIIATDINSNVLDMKACSSIDMTTSPNGKVSFTYLYDGVDLLINKGEVYVEMT